MANYAKWLELKQVEAEAAKARREIEDEIFSSMDLSEGGEGSTTTESEGFKIKVTQRLTRTVDADSLQEIAAEEGLSEHLSSLFRWKPSLDMNRWKATAAEITGPLEAAITTKAGRPSFSIETIEEK
jgi:hypothetical protein